MRTVVHTEERRTDIWAAGGRVARLRRATRYRSGSPFFVVAFVVVVAAGVGAVAAREAVDGAGAGDDVVRSGGGGGVRAVADLPERDGYVANPGMGWQDMDQRHPSFAQDIEYIRPTAGWAGLNPRPGEYEWSVIDEPMAAARRRGHRLSLRIYTMRHPARGGHKVPQWVLDDGATIVDGEPDYSNATYQRHWATFVDALRRRYDGHPDLAFIDVSGYGNYNEWSWQNQTQWERGWELGEPFATLDGQARQRLADMFLGGSATVEATDARGRVVSVDYDYPGFRRTQLVMPYAGIRQSLWYALAKRPDVGWRYDCLGNISVADLRELGAVALSRWRDAPMIYEFCSVVDWSSAARAAELTRPVLLHDNATDERERVAALLRDVGYRYVLDEARWTPDVGAGTAVDVTMRWRNTGGSRAYPTLGVDPRIEIRLLNEADGVVSQATVSNDVARWLPGRVQTARTTLTLPDGVPSATYRLQVGMRNAASDDLIALAMADATDAGWLPLGKVNVR